MVGSMLHGPQKSKFPKMGISEGASLGASSCEERRLVEAACHVKVTVRLIYSFGVSTEEWFAFSSAQRSNSFLA